MSEAEIRIEFDGRYMFVSFDGKRIAKRGGCPAIASTALSITARSASKCCRRLAADALEATDDEMRAGATRHNRGTSYEKCV